MTNAKSRKVVLLVVEGPSDKTTWENAIRNTLRTVYPDLNTNIQVVHGDSTVMDSRAHNVSATEVISNVQKTVNSYLKDQKGLHGLKTSDILAIAQIADLDACYADASAFIQDVAVDEPVYDIDKEVVRCPNPGSLSFQRENKRSNLNRLWKAGHLTFAGKEIPYRLFYLNINLEHALYGKANCTEEEKEMLSEDFDAQYGDGGPAFLSRLDAIPCIGENYPKSWEESKLNGNAFSRLENLKLLFSWFNELAKAN